MKRVPAALLAVALAACEPAAPLPPREDTATVTARNADEEVVGSVTCALSRWQDFDKAVGDNGFCVIVGERMAAFLAANGDAR